MDSIKTLKLCTTIITVVNLLAVLYLSFYAAAFSVDNQQPIYLVYAGLILAFGCTGAILFRSLLEVFADIAETNHRILEHLEDKKVE